MSSAAAFTAFLLLCALRTGQTQTTTNICDPALFGSTISVSSSLTAQPLLLATNLAATYPSNVLCRVTLVPSSDRSLNLTFTAFSTESCCDGFSALPLLGVTRGSSIPNGGRPLFSQLGQSITLEFSSDSSVESTGVRLRVVSSTTIGSPSPTPSITPTPAPTPSPSPTPPPALSCASVADVSSFSVCVEGDSPAATLGASAAGLALSSLLPLAALGLGWLCLVRQAGGAPLPPAAAFSEPPGLRLSMYLLLFSSVLAFGALLYSITAAGIPWVVFGFPGSGGDSVSYAVWPLLGLRRTECRGSVCITTALPDSTLLYSLPQLRTIGALLILFALGFALPAALLAASSALALKRHLLLLSTQAPGSADKAAEAVAPSCGRNVHAVFALLWTSFAVLSVLYIWMEVLVGVESSGVQVEGNPGATAASLAGTCALIAGVLSTMASCRLGGVKGLQPGPCAACCGGRCSGGGGSGSGYPGRFPPPQMQPPTQVVYIETTSPMAAGWGRA